VFDAFDAVENHFKTAFEGKKDVVEALNRYV
jgi:hypothetical protein